MPGIVLDMILGAPRSGVATDLRNDHNKGWFLDALALRAAYPTAEAGDFATVGGGTYGPSVWVWDVYILDWEDSAASGLVVSVFGRTGTVIAQSGDYAAFYEPINANIQAHIADVTTNPHAVTAVQVGADATGTASGLIGTHESTYAHGDIATNSAARHTRLHALNDALDHSGNLDASQLPLGGNWALTSGLVINSGAAAVDITINRKTSGIAFKYDNTADGILGDFIKATAVGRNACLGYQAGNALAAATLYDIFIGYRAGYATSGGTGYNIAIGFETFAKHTNTDTGYNVYIGYWVANRRNGATQTTNVAIGYRAMMGSLILGDNTGSGNVCIGSNAGFQLSSGSSNILILGSTSLQTGSRNVWIGADAGTGGAAGTERGIYLGSYAGSYETGNYKFYVNCLIKADEATNRADSLMYGVMAGASINQTLAINAVTTVKHGLTVNSAATAHNFTVNRVTSGTAFQYDGTNDLISGDFIKVSSAGTHRTAIGYQALNADTTGAGFNVGVGRSSGLLITTGSYNVAVGAYALDALTTSAGNVAVGFGALGACTGGNNVAVGNESFQAAVAQANNIGLGCYAGYYETGSDKLYITAFQHIDEAGGRDNAILYGVMASGGYATQLLYANASLITPSDLYHYFGKTDVDGTWRIGRSGNDLVIERRESGSYVTKQTISA